MIASEISAVDPQVCDTVIAKMCDIRWLCHGSYLQRVPDAADKEESFLCPPDFP
jgi:hypothetical protein